MNILIVTPHYYPENFRINDLVKELKNKSHNITVLTAIPDYPAGKYYSGYGLFKKNREVLEGVSIYRAPIIARGSGTKLRLFLNYFSLIFGSLFTSLFLLNRNFDVIFVFAPSPITIAIPAIIIKKIKNILLCLWVQDLWPESVSASGKLKSNIIPRLLNPLVKFIYKNSNKILVPSNGYKLSIKKKGISESKISFLPNWAEKIYKVIKNSEKKLDFIPNNSFKIMFAGNIGFAQDFPSILNAAKILKNENIHWLILGNGSKVQWVKKRIQNYELMDCFHMLGTYPVNEMPQFFSLADAMLFSLIDEDIFSLTIPSKVQSYLACGKPILGMINGEGSDLINNSNAGLTCPAGDSRGLSENILKMSNMSSDEINKIGNNSYNYYKKHFDRKMLINKVENILSDLIR